MQTSVLIIVLTLIILGFGGFIYYFYRQKKKDLRLLKKQRTMLEEALAEASEKEAGLRAVFQHSNAGIFICSAMDYNLTFANDIFIDMLQIPRNDYQNISILPYIAGKDREKVAERLKLMKDGRAGELRMDVLIDGEQDFQSWVDLSVSPVIQSDGEVKMFIGIAVDNTNKKIFESKLDATKKRYRQLVDNLDDVVGLIDPDGKILFFNQAGMDYHQGTAKEIYGKFFQDYYSESDAKKIKSIKDAAFQTGRISKGIIHITLHGKKYVVELKAIPLFESDGSIRMIQTIGKNMNEHVRMMDELRQAKEGVERIMQAVPDVVYSVVYDAGSGKFSFEFLSKKIEALTGYAVEKFLTEDFDYKTIVSESDLQEMVNFDQVENEGVKVRYSFIIRHKNGTIIKVIDHADITKISQNKFRITGAVRIE